MGWIGCVRCEKLLSDFVAQTFTLITPVHPVLHRVSCSYETIPNAPKHYATHQNMSLGSNGVDWVRSLRKISTWLRGTNFCINCTSWPRFCVEFHTVRKRSQMHSNTMQHTKTWFYALMGPIRCVRCKKLQRDFVARTFAIIAPVNPFCTEFHAVTIR